MNHPVQPCIGLIGGLGVGATIYYYQHLARACHERSRPLNLTMVHAESARVHAFVERNDGKGLAAYLAEFIKRLKAAGAEIAVIPAVTPHFCLEELNRVSELPVLDIFRPINDELAVRKIRRATVFGTRFVMNSALYGRVKEIEIVPARLDETDHIHEIYLELVRSGQGSEGQHADLTKLARTLCEREALDAVILAGTDFATLFHATSTDFPSVDCAALHVRAIVKSPAHGVD